MIFLGCLAVRADSVQPLKASAHPDVFSVLEVSNQSKLLSNSTDVKIYLRKCCTVFRDADWKIHSAITKDLLRIASFILVLPVRTRSYLPFL